MKKYAFIAAASSLALVCIMAAPDARAGRKPPIAISIKPNATPMKDCAVEGRTMFQRMLDLFERFT